MWNYHSRFEKPSSVVFGASDYIIRDYSRAESQAWLNKKDYTKQTSRHLKKTLLGSIAQHESMPFKWHFVPFNLNFPSGGMRP